MLALVQLFDGATRDLSCFSSSSSTSCCGLMVAGCKVAILRPQVTSKQGRGKGTREAEGLGDTAESVPSSQESRGEFPWLSSS